MGSPRATSPSPCARRRVGRRPQPAACPRPRPSRLRGQDEGIAGGFRDFDAAIDDVSVDADRVWFRWTMRGHHVGPFAGIESTGRPVVVEGMNLEVFSGDHIAEHLSQFDRLGIIEG